MVFGYFETALRRKKGGGFGDQTCNDVSNSEVRKTTSTMDEVDFRVTFLLVNDH